MWKYILKLHLVLESYFNKLINSQYNFDSEGIVKVFFSQILNNILSQVAQFQKKKDFLLSAIILKTSSTLYIV